VRNTPRRIPLAAFLVVVSLSGGGVLPVQALPGHAALAAESAAPTVDVARAPAAALSQTLLAKAAVDECYAGIGVDYPPVDADGTCPSGKPKRNQGYLWGLTKHKNNLWFGTIPNPTCIAEGVNLESTDPRENSGWVCEFGESQMVDLFPSLPDGYGDWRPPKAFRYEQSTGNLVDLMSPPPANATTADVLRFNTTLGIRSAGSVGDAVLMAGPGLSSGINVFIWNAKTGAFVGSISLPSLSNIRKWIVVNGALYTAVKTNSGQGRVLRWQGKLSKRPVASDFQVVGNLDAEGSELALHQGRLFVTTWSGGPGMPGLYMSPTVPGGGLKSSHAGGWRKVWEMDDYDPDPVTARSAHGGALASYGGYLFWGTMHVVGNAARAHREAYPSADPSLAFTNTQRAISIFRGKDFGSSLQKIDLLYGESALPAYDPVLGWGIQPTRGGPVLMGPSGFGNSFNCYTWTMAVFGGKLYVGTMDWSFLLTLFQSAPSSLADDVPREFVDALVDPPVSTLGADLWRFDSATLNAQPENLGGVGNSANYGIRTMIADDALYLGTANPFNIHPDGGWELLRLQ
jgi:hypothetical protein